MENELTGVILAGGYGSRMGFVEKGLIQIHEEPQYVFLYRLLRQFTDKVVLSVRSEQIPLYERLPDMSIISDLYRDIGPMGGILSCLKSLQKPVLVLSCDLTQIEAQAIEIMISERNPEYCGTIFQDEISSYLQPLVAIYELKSIPLMEHTIEAGDYSLHRLIKAHDFKIIPTKESEWFRNVNYPD